jgi:DNA-binding NtrC family response regulator
MLDPTVLLASSDRSLVQSIGGILSSTERLRLEVAPGLDQACDRVGRDGVLLVLAHLGEESSVTGITRLLQTISITNPSAKLLVLSDRYHAEQALALLRLGVADYLARPLDLSRLAYLVDALTLEARYTGQRPAPIPEPVSPAEATGSFIDLPTTKMGRLMQQIRRIAAQDTTILLDGETGTGKTRLASQIHQLSSNPDRPFLAINCGALSSSLIESEMFGHVKGAFTGADTDRVGKFAEVGKGTLFLDEVDSLPLSLQAKLLRAVEERVFEPVGSNKSQPMQARLIVASSRPLEQEVTAGRFRVDLYYRLNVVAFTIPPLRERKDVIPHLVRGFLDESSARAGRPVTGIAPEPLRALQEHTWPGNIRELRNVIERAVALCPSHVIHLEDLPELFHHIQPDPEPARRPGPATPSLVRSKDEAERYCITDALKRNGNNRLRAASELGISRMTLYNKLHKHGLMLGA